MGRLNRRYRRTGTLWEERYRACLVDCERHFLSCHRYIELNPVRAGMVRDPGEYAWSSHGHYGLGRPDEVLSTDDVCRGLGSTPDARREAYRALCSEALDAHAPAEMRAALEHNHVLGSVLFTSQSSGHSAEGSARAGAGGR